MDKKKASNIDEYIVGTNIIHDNEAKFFNNKETENTSKQIDSEELMFYNYDDIVDVIEKNGWSLKSSVTNSLTILDKQIVFFNPANANSYDIFLEIVCPPEMIITICGFDDSDIAPDDFYNFSNLYQIPHFFTLRCMDNNNSDLSSTTIISILKYRKNKEIEKYYQAFYGDLSPIIDGRLKKKQERYYFAETIVLQGGEKLIFRVHYPNIDISKIDLLMMVDLFEKDKEEINDNDQYVQ